ncbi:MAG: nucleoside-diphosphate kinase [Bacillota bacterium]|jgi:nucleoside-diphosphate kinase
MERSLVLIKPDGIQRLLVGEVISRLERKGLRLLGMKLMLVPESLAREHYRQHEGKGFFRGLISYITSSPVVAMVWEGPRAIGVIRDLTGATDPSKAQPGTIRGDYGLDVSFNMVHASDSAESALREVALFFPPGEVIEYRRSVDEWLWVL